MDIKDHVKHLDGIARCIEVHPDDLERKFLLIRVITKVFIKVRVFFTRLFALIIYHHWYTNAKAKKIAKLYIFEADARVKSDKRAPKILKIIQKLGKEAANLNQMALIKADFSDDKGAVYHSVKKMPIISDRLLFHIHGDEFGLNNENLEGFNSKATLSYLNAYLKGRKEQGLALYGLQENDLKEIEEAVALSRSKDWIKSAKELLSQKKKVLMPGGWAGKPGHAMYYEVIPEKDEETVTLRVFNLGSGAKNHVHGLVGNKPKAFPYCDFKGIRRARILDEHVLQTIDEMNTKATFPGTDTKTEYSAKDIYVGLRRLLKPTTVDEREIEVDELMSTQRSGICAWRSLMAFLATRMEKKEYKQFAVDIKLQSLTSKVNGVTKKMKIPQQEEWRLVNKSYRKLCRKVTNAYSERVVGKRYLARAAHKLRKVSHWLKENKERCLKHPDQTYQPEFTWRSLKIPEEGLLSDRVPLSEQVHQRTIDLDVEPCTHLISQIKGQSLETVRTLCEAAFNRGEYHAVHLAILHFVKDLPMEVNVQDKAVAETTIHHYGELAKLFFNSCFHIPQADIIHGEKLYVPLKLMRLQKKLAWAIDSRVGRCHFPLGFMASTWDKTDFFLKWTDQKIAHEFRELASNGYGGDATYRFDGSRPYGESSRIEFSTKDHKVWSKELFEIFADVHQTLSQDPSYKGLETPGQCARLYASDRLPDWFRQLRETHLSLLYLAHEPVARPTNGACTFTFQFSFEETKDNRKNPLSFMKFSLKEMTGEILNQYPHLQKGRGELLYRYERNFRPLDSDKMRRFFDYVSKYQHGVEKSLLADHVRNHDIGLTDEEFKELGHLFIGETTRISKAFEYFYRHPEKLRDLDYQILFEILFFHRNHLPQDREFADRFNGFLLKNLNQALAENEVQTAVFLLRIRRLIGQDTVETLRQILSRNGLDPAERSVVYAELAATLSKKSRLEGADVKDLLIATTYLKDHPVPTKWMVPETTKEAFDALHIHSKQIAESLNEDLLNAIREGQEWKVQFPLVESTDGEIVYYPLKGEMRSKNGERTLPQEILEHPHFKQVFGTRSKGILRENGIYEIDSSNFVQLHKGELMIDRKREGKWVRFVPREVLIGHLKSRHLKQNFNHWVDLKNLQTIHIVDPQTGQTTYEAHLNNGFVNSVTEVDTGLTLSDPSPFFKRFESEHYIQEWYKKGELSKVQLPRFGLSFTSNNEKIYSDQYDGYFLSTDQYLPSLGSASNYLVLENTNGEKKVLMPQQKLLADPKKRESLQPLFHFDRQDAVEDNVPQKVLVLENGREANLYLATILTAEQEYETAASYLKKYGAKLTPYKTSESDSLGMIVGMGEITGDSSGNGLALQLYAAKLLMKNHFDHNHPIHKDFVEKVGRIYSDYLSHYHNVTALRLEKGEELFLLKYLLNQAFDPKLYIRLGELDPTYAATYKMPVKKQQAQPKRSELSFTRLLGNQDIPAWVRKRGSINFEGTLISRLNPHIQRSPYAFYDLAKHATEDQKRWLRDALTFSRHAPGSAWGAFIECVLENPQSFPELPSEYDAEWFPQVLKIADDLNTDKLEKLFEEPKAPASRLFTPAKLDPINTETPEIALDFKLSEIEPFKATGFQSKEITEKNGHALQAWVRGEASEPKSQEPLYKKELDRIDADLDAHRENGTHMEYEITSLSDIENTLKEGKESVKALEVELITLANVKSDNYLEQIRRDLRVNGKAERIITLDDLFVSFAKQDPESLVRLNPLLDEEKINTLYQKVGEYLLLATHEQQRARAEASFAKLEGTEGPERYDLTQQLAVDLLSKRQYDPNKFPAYLVFEYYADILMREVQVKKLGLFLEKGDLNPVMEMIMGSGKSKVLLPLLGLLRADGEKVSMLIVPQALFESVSSDTQKILSEAFSQSLRALHFDRNTTFTAQSLEIIRDDLRNLQKNKECLIVTSKSIQCLLLKFIEQSKDGVENDELMLMREIVQLLAEHGYPIIDEADTVLNVLHEVCFSTGHKRSPKGEEIELISSIYEILYADPEIRSVAKLESDSQPENESDVLTEQVYHSKVKRLLAKKVSERLDQSLSEADRQASISYLFHDEGNVEAAQRFFNRQNDEMQNKLALAGEEIASFLPHTLTRICDEKYGLDQEGFGSIAIPFAAANTPNRGSHFANHYITMNYTFQYYVKKGVSTEIVRQELERIQAEAIKELKEGGQGALLEETRAWKIFQKLRGDLDIPLFNCKEAHIDHLVQAINENQSKIREFVSQVILPQLDLFTHKLSCNPHNLIAFFSIVLGFTGTLWNSFSMHSKLKPEPEPGTDAKTLNILWEHSRNEVYTITEGTPEKMIQQIDVQGIAYDLISDAGGYFKEGGNTVIAKALSKFKKRPVIFYNAQNQQAETDGTREILLSESTTPIEERDTFLDQRHTTGSDVKQKRDAVGLVTIGRNMLLRDLLQSVWRLRGLAKSQRVKFVLSEEVKAIITQTLNKDSAEEIKFDDILLFTIINQSTQQGKDNFKGLRQELASLPQALLVEVLMHEEYTTEQRKQAFEVLQEEWITSALKDPKDCFGKISVKEDCERVLAEELNKCEAHLTEIFNQLPFLSRKDQVLGSIRAIADRLKGRLPAKIMVPLRDTDDDQTVEIEQEQQQETETELEVKEHQETGKVKLGTTDGYTGFKKVEDLNALLFQRADRIKYFSLKLYMSQDEQLRPYADLFDGVYLTINALEWPEKDPKVADMKLLGNHRTPFHYVKLNGDEMIILSQSDLLGDQYNIFYGRYDQQPISELQQEQIVKIKFLNGESSYTKKELAFLKRWIEENGKDKMLQFFHRHILAGYPMKAAAYSNSNLKDLFQKIA